jgi:Fe/S biogenesis protein NfuA
MAISITDDALARVLEVRSREHDPERLALWVEIVGVAGGAYQYDMSFLRHDEIDETDVVVDARAIRLVVPRLDGPALDQATIAMDGRLGGGLVIDNPSAPAQTSPALNLPPLPELHGDTAERVRQVLDVQVNPAIAAHGGHAELVAVEEGSAYLRLAGGCQGCGMAAVTLRQGIEGALRAGVPEIERVVDVTDHAAGANPYYEPAGR